MSKNRFSRCGVLLAACCAATLNIQALDYTNTTSGGYNTAIWNLAGNPGDTNTSDNVVVTSGAVAMQFAYAASNDFINVNTFGRLTNNVAFGLSGAIVSLNNGGRLFVGTAADTLAAAVIRLNGGVMQYSTFGGLSSLGALEVWDNSVITNSYTSGSTGNYTNYSLDFTVANKTLTIATTATGPQTYWFNSVMVSNNATLLFAKLGVGSLGVNLQNVTLTSTSTLTVTNTGTLTLGGGNGGMSGTLDIRNGVYAIVNSSVGTSTVTLNNGATLSVGALQNSLGNVVRLNGGNLLFSAGNQTVNYAGNLQVWDDSVILKTVSGGGTANFTNSTLDFTRADKALTFALTANGSGDLNLRFQSVMVSNDATTILARTGLGAGDFSVQYNNLAITAGSTLTVTNSTGGNLPLTIMGNNTGIEAGSAVEVRAGARVVATAANSLGNAALLLTGGTLTKSATAGVHDVITITDGMLFANTAGVSHRVGLGWSNQTVLVSGSSSVFSNLAVFVVGTNEAVNNVVTLASDGVLFATAVNVGNSLAATANGLVISNGGSVLGGSLTIGNNGSTGNYYRVLGGGTASNGVLTIGGTRSGFNALSVSNATLHNNGAVTIGSGSSNNTATVFDDGTFDLLGNQLTLGLGAARSNQLLISGGTVLAGNLVVTGVANRVVLNAGTLSVRGTVYSNDTVLVVGDGSNAATLSLSAGGSGYHYFQAGLTIAPAATLRGTGTITGNTLVNGTIAPGASLGTLVFSNDLTLAGSYEAQLDGTGTGSADQLIVVGELSLAGATLNVSELVGVDDLAYVIATYGSLDGTFAGVTGLPGGYTVDYTYNSGSQIAIVLIPEPGVAALVVLGLCALWVVGHNRRRFSRWQ
ncbi:MAG: hypothetical protein PCFJNLEI_02077 [Verrucomicrobiae bacterium]|nr:hypothetical protein [Verrucomicrobiae bacterium]